MSTWQYELVHPSVYISHLIFVKLSCVDRIFQISLAATRSVCVSCLCISILDSNFCVSSSFLADGEVIYVDVDVYVSWVDMLMHR